MNVMLVACNTIEDEINAAQKRLGLNYPVIWVEGGLHDWINKLRDRVQEVFEEADGKCDHLIFALGYCGGGVSEVTTGNYTTILPLTDDCISVLLGSLDERIRTSKPVTFYLTDSWMRHENNVVDDNNRLIAKFGEAKACKIQKSVFNHYERFAFVDTGTYDLDAAKKKIEPLSESVGLRVESLPGSSAWLDKLLTGPWDDSSQFLVVPPNSDIEFENWQPLLAKVESIKVGG